MRISCTFVSDCGGKDLFERMGDSCLKIGQKSFGYQRIKSLAGQTKTEVVKKITSSVAWIFLFFLSLPLSVGLSLLGCVFIELSNTHKKKYKNLQEQLLKLHSDSQPKVTPNPVTPQPNPQPTPDQALSPAEKQNNALTEWQKTFDKLAKTYNGNPNLLSGFLKQHRVALYNETMAICNQGHYYLGEEKIELDEGLKKNMIEQTSLFSLQEKLADLSEGERLDTIIEVIEEDTFDLAERYQKEGLKPIGLNMANAYQAGGGAKTGCGAQEESLFRRSNYFQALYPQQNKMYPIPNHSVIYTPDVQVFRTRETDLTKTEENRVAGYQFRNKFAVDMVASAFYDLRGVLSLPNDYEENTRNKIRNILRVAYKTGHDSLVLGAIGCGAFANDPRVIVQWFKEELLSDEFRGRFKQIGFGIIYPKIKYKEENIDLLELFKSQLCKDI